ncbi:MAG: hypothetical protein L0212_09720 [Acidobacteria bacterium]|nr:hypothetical protein [Acidobacteriota bacterium]
MRRAGDNRFPEAWREVAVTAAAAVLLGNGFYFLVLFSWLPQRWQHRPFELDPGLGLDFLLCLGAYIVLRQGRRWFDWGRGRQ